MNLKILNCVYIRYIYCLHNYEFVHFIDVYTVEGLFISHSHKLVEIFFYKNFRGLLFSHPITLRCMLHVHCACMMMNLYIHYIIVLQWTCTMYIVHCTYFEIEINPSLDIQFDPMKFYILQKLTGLWGSRGSDFL